MTLTIGLPITPRVTLHPPTRPVGGRKVLPLFSDVRNAFTFVEPRGTSKGNMYFIYCGIKSMLVVGAPQSQKLGVGSW